LYNTTMDEFPSLKEQKVFPLISELFQVVRCCQQEEVFCQNITFSQFFILQAIAQKKSMKLAELHEILAVKKSTTTRLMSPLVQKRLIVREKSEHDSRALILKLTKKGEGVYGQVWECFAAFLNAVQGGIPKGKRGEVYAGTKIFLAALRRACAEKNCKS